MFRIFCLLAFFFPVILSAQPLNKLQKESYQTLAFKVTAAQADKYLSKNDINVDKFAQQTPFRTLKHYHDYEDSLPVGFYVLLNVKDSMLNAELVSVSNLIVYTINNQKRVQIEVRDKEGNFIANALVTSNNKNCKFNDQAKNYVIPQKKPEKALIRVYTLQDSTFIYLDEKNENWKAPKPIAVQKWNIFKLTKTYKIISWVPKKIHTLFSKKHSRYYAYKSAGTRGLIVFNQPKYKLGDTVKLKAYLFNKENKPYKKPVDIYLEYYTHNKGLQSQQLTNINSTENNSFIYEFILRDTLFNDISYTVVLKDKEKHRLLQNNFRAEDYVLDEVATYSLRSEKNDYYKNDTLKFYAEAKDANGLPLLDGTANLILTTSQIDTFYKKELQIPDTLFTEEKKLATEGDTKFTVPSTIFPNANLKIQATLVFKNSNNEIQERKQNISYNFHIQKLIVKQIEDTVYADVIEDNKSIVASGEMETDGQFERKLKIVFPFKTKIDPLVDEYDFNWTRNDSIIQTEHLNYIQYYNVSLSQTSNGDTLGFVLYNPYKIPVNYSVFKNNRLLETGKDSIAEIKWQRLTHDKKSMLTIKWQYRWQGNEKSSSQNIALLYKKLNLNVQQARYVFPGQKDSIEITATDFKNKPASNVNITALSYNGQFKENRPVPDPPYLQSYHVKPQLLFKNYERNDDNSLMHSYSLGKHTAFIKKFGLDTMLYYKILFPADTVNDFSTPIENYIPQISIHVVKQGVPQKIFILNINNRPVYYYNTTVNSPYSFLALHGYNKIGIRLSDKYIEIDSLYIQPFYKHDFVFDVDKLPAQAKVLSQENFLSDAEKWTLENSLFQLKYNYQTTNSYLWQIGKLDSASSYQDQILGPFLPYDSIHFYAPGRFDIHFIFEPTYQYTLSNKILRLEKNKIFDDKKKYFLQQAKGFSLMLGDTLKTLPTINYTKTASPKKRYISVDPYWFIKYRYDSVLNGSLKLEFEKDTAFAYLILKPFKVNGERIVRSFNKSSGKIPVGYYKLYLVMSDLSTVSIDSINIIPNSTLCKKIQSLTFTQNDKFIDSIADENEEKPVIKEIPKPINIVEVLPAYYPKGNRNIFGTITDAKGKLPIAGASIIIKGTKAGTNSYSNGYFAIKTIRPGKYTLVISSIGYVSKEVEVTVPENGNAEIKVGLDVTTASLNDVVVVGYGTVRKSSLTGAVAMIKQEEDYDKVFTTVNIPNQPQGRVAELQLNDSKLFEQSNIRIRGLASPNISNPIYVIDGIIYDEMPQNISPEMIESIEVLKDAAATSIYGSRAVNGVIVITTKTKSLRQTFRDYAFWKPELISDENGKVKLEVTYPDNVTSWKNYFLAMDKHLRIGKTVSLTQAYKPVMAQLSVPQFLIEGDSAVLIGKMMNYTGDNYNVTDKFSINDIEKISEKNILTPKASVITSLPCFLAAISDTIKTTFNLQTETGFKDGEERKIPVFKQGVEESDGQFMILKNDTSINYTNNQPNTGFTLSVENKTLDVLLKEIEHLKNYPFACMEQTASKLSGLLMEKKIDEYLHLKFKDEKMIHQLVEKIQKNQMYSGGWSWWEKERENFYISNYIINALLPLRSDAVIETNIRNGLLYLQNQLPKADNHLLLEALTTMVSAKHLMAYQPFIDKINFDSLNMHEKWQWIFIQQQTKGNYDKQLKQLIEQKQQSMLGGVYWGNENYIWYNNTTSTTVLAYKVLQNEPEYSDLLPKIVQHFFEIKQKGYWQNTVESASILNTVLPEVFNQNKNIQQSTLLNISGDTSFSVSAFPFVKVFSNNIKNISIGKTGGGYTYLSLYKTWFNRHPDEVTDKFDIKTYFKKNGKTQQYIQSGEKIKMVVDIHVKKDAEYVMIDVPIPAGCTYASKNNNEWNVHKEYFKNKVVMFFENLNTGNYSYEIELEPRYTGKYFINPCKAELMYFPTFYGRNEIKSIEIK